MGDMIQAKEIYARCQRLWPKLADQNADQGEQWCKAFASVNRVEMLKTIDDIYALVKYTPTLGTVMSAYKASFGGQTPHIEQTQHMQHSEIERAKRDQAEMRSFVAANIDAVLQARLDDMETKSGATWWAKDDQTDDPTEWSIQKISRVCYLLGALT